MKYIFFLPYKGKMPGYMVTWLQNPESLDFTGVSAL